MNCKLSIIIVNWNTSYYLKPLLNQLFRYTKKYPWEVIVVDNDSRLDDSKNFLKSFLEKHTRNKIRIIFNQTNNFFAQANNQGVAEAKGEYILILNPDTLIDVESIIRLLEWVQSGNADAVTPLMKNRHGKSDKNFHNFSYAPDQIKTVLSVKNLITNHLPMVGIYRKNFIEEELPTVPIQVDWIWAACLMTPRALFNYIGQFNENYPIYDNDAELCFRMKKANKKIIFDPTIKIIHYGNQACKLMGFNWRIEENIKMRIQLYNEFYPNPIKVLLIASILYISGIYMSLLLIVLRRLNYIEDRPYFQIYYPAIRKCATDYMKLFL